MLHTLITRLEEIKLEMIWKLPPQCVAFIALNVLCWLLEEKSRVAHPGVNPQAPVMTRQDTPMGAIVA